MLYDSATNGFYPAGQAPEGAKVVSKSVYRDLLLQQEKGKCIRPDEDGNPVAVDPQQPSPDQRRVRAKQDIDTAAGSARARFVSAGQLVEEEYRLALQQTQAWRTAGNPADDIPAAIQDWSSAAGITPEQAAQSIEQTATAWEGVLLSVRQLRLNGKAAIDNAADDADFSAIAQGYIDQLNALKPE